MKMRPAAIRDFQSFSCVPSHVRLEAAADMARLDDVDPSIPDFHSRVVVLAHSRAHGATDVALIGRLRRIARAAINAKPTRPTGCSRTQEQYGTLCRWSPIYTVSDARRQSDGPPTFARQQVRTARNGLANFRAADESACASKNSLSTKKLPIFRVEPALLSWLIRV